MTGRVLQFESDVHKVVDALLPWYVNGTLTPEESDFVQKHLDGCGQCKQEAEWLRELQAACVTAESAPGGSSALRNLRSQLEARRPGRPARAWTRGGSWTRWGLAASFVVLAAFALSVMRDSVVAPYRTLASPNSVAAKGSLVVVFDPATTEAELRRILRGAGARLVDGPTRQNAYVIDVPSAQLDAATRVLRAERSVVLVERLSQEGSP